MCNGFSLPSIREKFLSDCICEFPDVYSTGAHPSDVAGQPTPKKLNLSSPAMKDVMGMFYKKGIYLAIAASQPTAMICSPSLSE